MSDLSQALRLAGAGSSWKGAVRAVAVVNVTKTGAQTIDGVALVAGDRVLLTAQTSAVENGIWVVYGGAWQRADDWGVDAFAKLGSTCIVLQGTTYANSQWTLTSPATGSVTIGSTALTFTRSDLAVVGESAAVPGSIAQRDDDGRADVGAFFRGSNTVYIAPSTAAANRAAINAAIAAGQRIVLLGDSVYELDEPIDIEEGEVDIEAIGGPATMTASLLWNSGAVGVENRSNAIIRIRPRESATAATTITTRAIPQATSVGVGSATGFAAGGWFKILGTSGSDDFYGQSAGPNAPAEEINRVASSYAGGSTIPFELTNFGHHGLSAASLSNKSIKLLDAMVDRVRIKNIRFDVHDPAKPVVCCAVSVDFSRNVTIRNCSAKGFIYNAFMLYGCKGISVHDNEDLGANNNFVEIRTCQQGFAANDVPRFEVYERFNSRGGAKPQGRICVRSQSRNIVLMNVPVQHAVMGYKLWGGIDVYGRGLQAVDCDLAEIMTTNGFTDDAGGRRGVAFDQGANDVATAEFGHNVDLEIQASGIYAGTTGFWSSDIPNNWHAGFYVHDTFDQRCHLRLENLGDHGLAAGRKLILGITCQDSSGELQASIRGSGYLGRFSGPINGWNGGSRLYFEKKAGSGSGAANTLLLEGGGTSSPCFDEVYVQPGPAIGLLMEPYAVTSPTFARPIIRRWVNPVGAEGLTACSVVLGRFPDSTASGNMVAGRAYLIDPAPAAGLRHLIPHATTAPTADARAAVVLSHYHGFNAGVQKLVPCVELGPACCAPIKAGAALNPRSAVELNATGQAVALGNGASDIATIQRWAGTTRFKTAGGDAYVQLGDE